MDRLTKRDESGCLNHPWEFNGVNGSYDIWDEDLLEKQIERLASYEDTGLEPEEIYEVRFLIAAQRDPQKLARLRELVLADQDGRLVVLPCNVGDHVWVNGREAIVVWFFGYKTERYLHTQFLDNAQYIDIPFSEIGKTVFLTREEAEAALSGKAVNPNG